MSKQEFDVESLIPSEWRFLKADFSMLARGSHAEGYAMLVRDAAGHAEFHALPEDSPEYEEFQLYVSGTGKTISEAIAAAVSAIRKPKATDA